MDPIGLFLLLLLFGGGAKPRPMELVFAVDSDDAAVRQLKRLESMGTVIAMASTGQRLDVVWQPSSSDTSQIDVPGSTLTKSDWAEA